MRPTCLLDLPADLSERIHQRLRVSLIQEGMVFTTARRCHLPVAGIVLGALS